MKVTPLNEIMQRWWIVQEELIPGLGSELECLTPPLEKLIHVLEWVRIEEWAKGTWCGIGRRPHDRGALANAWVAKVVLKLETTTALIERLQVDRALRRICGFPRWKKLPNEATFSRAGAEFARSQLAARVHEAVVKEALGESLIGHISRDGTAIEAREKPQTKRAEAKLPEPAAPRRRGRPKKGEARVPEPTRLERQVKQSLSAMVAEWPTACDRGTKCNAQGYKVSWNGYKLHLDTTDCGVPVSALLTSASVHDSQVAIPLAAMTANRVTNGYDLMDAAYCSDVIRTHSRDLGHVPLIDHHPRGGEKIPFAPHEEARYRERTAAERANARLKDEFGGRHIWVRGAGKVMSHLMFGVLVLSVDQLMRLVH